MPRFNGRLPLPNMHTGFLDPRLDIRLNGSNPGVGQTIKPPTAEDMYFSPNADLLNEPRFARAVEFMGKMMDRYFDKADDLKMSMSKKEKRKKKREELKKLAEKWHEEDYGEDAKKRKLRKVGHYVGSKILGREVYRSGRVTKGDKESVSAILQNDRVSDTEDIKGIGDAKSRRHLSLALKELNKKGGDLAAAIQRGDKTEETQNAYHAKRGQIARVRARLDALNEERTSELSAALERIASMDGDKITGREARAFVRVLAYHKIATTLPRFEKFLLSRPARERRKLLKIYEKTQKRRLAIDYYEAHESTKFAAPFNSDGERVADKGTNVGTTFGINYGGSPETIKRARRQHVHILKKIETDLRGGIARRGFAAVRRVLGRILTSVKAMGEKWIERFGRVGGHYGELIKESRDHRRYMKRIEQHAVDRRRGERLARGRHYRIAKKESRRGRAHEAARLRSKQQGEIIASILQDGNMRGLDEIQDARQLTLVRRKLQQQADRLASAAVLSGDRTQEAQEKLDTIAGNIAQIDAHIEKIRRDMEGRWNQPERPPRLSAITNDEEREAWVQHYEQVGRTARSIHDNIESIQHSIRVLTKGSKRFKKGSPDWERIKSDITKLRSRILDITTTRLRDERDRLMRTFNGLADRPEDDNATRAHKRLERERILGEIERIDSRANAVRSYPPIPSGPYPITPQPGRTALSEYSSTLAQTPPQNDANQDIPKYPKPDTGPKGQGDVGEQPPGKAGDGGTGQRPEPQVPPSAEPWVW